MSRSTGQPPHRLLRALFDLSFTDFVTLKIARALYALTIMTAGLVGLGLVLVGLQRSPLAGLGAAVLSVLFFLASVTFVRIALEVAVVFFRIADNTAEIAEHEAAVAMNTANLGSAMEGTS
ncbi:MAG: DUF4282 domain-containing protein [Gemmatimonadota bacterium]